MQRGKRSIRVDGVGRIIELFIRGRPATSPVWRTDAMHFATYVDSLLYAEAESIDEYSDPATLEDRVCSALRSIGPQEAHAIDSVGRSGLNDLDFASKDADRVVDAICSIQISACTPALQTQYGLLNCVRRIQRCMSLHAEDARVVQAAFNATGILCFQHPANQRACDLRIINSGMRKHSRNRSVILSGLSALLDVTSLPWEVDTGNDSVSDEDRAAARAKVRETLLGAGSAEVAISALRTFPGAEDLQTEACEVLSRCMNPDGGDLHAEQAVKVAIAAMKRFPYSVGINLSCTNLISSAAAGELADTHRVVTFIMGSIKTHSSSDDVIHNAFCAIRNVVRSGGVLHVVRCGGFEAAASHSETCTPAVETCLSILDLGHSIHEATAWRDPSGRTLEDVLCAASAQTMRSIIEKHKAASDKAFANLINEEDVRKCQERVKAAAMRKRKAEREDQQRCLPKAVAIESDPIPSEPPTPPPKANVSSKLKRDLWASVVRYCDEDRCTCETPMCETCESCAVVRDMVLHARQLFRNLEI